MSTQNYEKSFKDYWEEKVSNEDGSLNKDKVMRELHDYRMLMTEVSKAYDLVTNGQISHPFTEYFHVVEAVENRIVKERNWNFPNNNS